MASLLARAPAHRERRSTFLRTTLCLAVLAACGSKHTDPYARGEQVQQQCCEHLAGAPRDQCLQSLPRPADASVAQSKTNQQTYACVVEHFACDASTGHPTRESAQAQLECIQDLQ